MRTQSTCLVNVAMRRILLLGIALALTLGLSGALPGAAAAASLSSVRVTNSPVNMHVYAELEGGINDKIKEAIHSGIPTTFTYFIEVRRHRRLRPDKTVFRTKVHHTVRYDALKKKYTFTTDARADAREVVLKDFDEVAERLQHLDHVALMPPGRLDPNARYTVRSKVEMKSIKLFFPLNYLLFFVSFWDFDTKWKGSEKFYVPFKQPGDARP